MTIEIQNISFNYEQRPLLNEVNLLIQSGQIVTLIGSSGSGKTTLLKLLNGLIAPDKGLLTINGEAMPKGHRHISYMMQDHMLLPWRTALENISLINELGKARGCNKEKILSLLEELGLKNFENHYPDELSLGMQQRVALGRALLQQRPILLLDEPFASLDVSLREQFYKLLRNIRQRFGTTILMVTHDFYDALALSDQIFFLKEGKIKKTWSVEKNNHQSLLQEMREEMIYSHSIVPGGLAVIS